MKSRVIQAIDIELKPSLILVGLLSVISMLSVVICWQLPLPLPINIFLIGLVLLSTIYYTLRDALLRLPNAWHRVEVSGLGQLKLTNQQGEQFTPRLANSSFIHPYLIILNIEGGGFIRGLPPMILFANKAYLQHRQLRVWLRWWQHDGAAASRGKD